MKPSLVEITSKYVGAPYKLGGWSVEEGFDCVSLIATIGEDIGLKMPKSFGDYDRSSYVEIWNKKPLEAKKLMLRFIASLGKEIESNFSSAWDLLVIMNRKDPLSFIVGINAGNGLVLSAFTDIGVNLVSLKSAGIRKVYRWVTVQR